MNAQSTGDLVIGALAGSFLGTMMLLVWGKMPLLLWQERESRRQFLIAIALIPCLVVAINLLHINHGFAWGDLARLFHEAARHSTVLDRTLGYIAAVGFSLFILALVLLFLILPGFGLQHVFHQTIRFLSPAASERFFTPRRLRLITSIYVMCTMLLVVTDGYMDVYRAVVPSFISDVARGSFLVALALHASLLAGLPAALWQWAKYADRVMDVDPAEARQLLASYAEVLQTGTFTSRSASELPASKRRLKKAFRVMVPIALADGDSEYLRAMATAYGLLACFGEGKKSGLAEALTLQVEWKEILGQGSTIASEANQVRAAVDQLPIAHVPAIREQTMRDIASAELLAKRRGLEDVG